MYYESKTRNTPLIDGFDDDSILTVGPLGVVAGAYDSLGIARVIDRAIPKSRHHNLSHSQVVKAMALNGLGFIERRLYLFLEFFEDIAVERLLGEGTTRELERPSPARPKSKPGGLR